MVVIMGRLLHIVCGAALLSGCASFTMAAADRSTVESATLVEACPLGVPWTRVAIADTAEGVSIDFASDPSRVTEVRQRVRDQALVHGPGSHRGPGHAGTHGGAHGGPRDHGLQLWKLGELVTAVSDTPKGAALVVTPVEPARRAEVREFLATRVAHLQSAGCAH